MSMQLSGPPKSPVFVTSGAVVVCQFDTLKLSTLPYFAVCHCSELVVRFRDGHAA